MVYNLIFSLNLTPTRMKLTCDAPNLNWTSREKERNKLMIFRWRIIIAHLIGLINLKMIGPNFEYSLNKFS